MKGFSGQNNLFLYIIIFRSMKNSGGVKQNGVKRGGVMCNEME